MSKEELIAYIESNPLPEHIAERFKDTIRDWELRCPIYCEETDTLSGVIPLAFTLAIAHDFSSEIMGGFNERYCFPNPDRAIEELVKWHKRKFDDQRPTGWVATRMVSKKAIKESFEKHHGKEYGHNILPYAFNGEFYASDTLAKNKKMATQELGMNIEEYESLAAFLKYSGQLEY